MKRLLLLFFLIFILFFTSCDSDFFSFETATIPDLSSNVTFEEAEKKIKEAGFTDVSFETIEDLEYSSEKDGVVEKITVDEKEKEDYKSYKKDSKIVIYYHTFPASIYEYVSPNAYVEYSNYTEEDYKALCNRIFSGFSLCYEKRGGEGSSSFSTIYYFNFELNFSIARFVRLTKGLPSKMYAYDIDGDVDNGWKTIDKGKTDSKFGYDASTKEVLVYNKNGVDFARYAANKSITGVIEDVGLDALLECLCELDDYSHEHHPYTSIYKQFLNTGKCL